MINAFSFCLGDTSWAIHATRFLRALERRRDVALVPLDGGGAPQPLPDDMLRMIERGRHPDERAPSIGIGPIEIMTRLRGPRRIAFVVWETTVMPEPKIRILQAVDEVWTPTEWGRRMLIANGLDPRRTKVVPQGVDVDIFRPAAPRRREGRPFRFLCVGKWEVRKGTDELVRAFCEEFRADEPVELMLHCSNPWIPRFDLEANIRRAAHGSHAPILASQPVSGDAIVDVYRDADAFVLPTRAEGWGLPIIEAMACGLPVIVTNYSAPAEYVHDAIGYPIRVEAMIDVDDRWFFPEGRAMGQWAQPDTAHLRAVMRHVFEHPDEASEKGRRAREEVCARWTWDHAAEKACAILDEAPTPAPALHTVQRELLEERLRNSEPPSSEDFDRRFRGRGIVLCGGGDIYFPCAWVCVRMLRDAGCTLPIELWYRGPREMTPSMIALMEAWDVQCVDAYEVARVHPYRRLDSWEIKPFAIAHSRFAEVLYVDVDNIALRDPEFLFDAEPYQRHGALFWPDRYSGPGTGIEWLKREAWQVCGVPYRAEPEVEAGQLVIDKRRTWRAMQLTLHLNEHSDYYYAYFYGDKDTFHLAWRRTATEYGLVPFAPRTLGRSEAMVQFDLEGAPLFHHRGGAKWTLTGTNPRVDGFAAEERCLRFLEELRRQWSPPIRIVPRDFSAIESETYRHLCDAAQFDYELEGIGHRTLELRPDFLIGRGAAEMEVSWMIEEDKDGGAVLSIRNANSPTCFLRLDGEGTWRGRWRVYHRARVELRPL